MHILLKLILDAFHIYIYYAKTSAETLFLKWPYFLYQNTTETKIKWSNATIVLYWIDFYFIYSKHSTNDEIERKKTATSLVSSKDFFRFIFFWIWNYFDIDEFLLSFKKIIKINYNYRNNHPDNYKQYFYKLSLWLARQKKSSSS